jgi:hypothetical protein
MRSTGDANAQTPKSVIHTNERVLIVEFAAPSGDKRATVTFTEAQSLKSTTVTKY